eukprot:COSAG06_NODE_4974_length_3817_cov_1.671329_6_plen_107_part_00
MDACVILYCFSCYQTESASSGVGLSLAYAPDRCFSAALLLQVCCSVFHYIAPAFSSSRLRDVCVTGLHCFADEMLDKRWDIIAANIDAAVTSGAGAQEFTCILKQP